MQSRGLAAVCDTTRLLDTKRQAISCCSFFFNDTATTEIYTLSLHDALPISNMTTDPFSLMRGAFCLQRALANDLARSEEHTSELQSQSNLVCRLLLEKKKSTTMMMSSIHLPFSRSRSFCLCRRWCSRVESIR